MIKQFSVGGFDNNFSYVVIDPASKKAAIVDPAGDLSLLMTYVESESLKVVSILVTHSHFDHIEGIPEVLKKWSATVYTHTNAKNHINRMPPKVNFVEDGDTIKLGGIIINVLSTPGHIDDAVCFQIRKQNNFEEEAIITGDTLFVEGCGRTNKSDVKNLYESLGRLKELDTDTNIYSGHDYGSIPVSTIGHELEKNRFFLAEDYEAFFNERFPKNSQDQ